jgi:D-arabinose 1-dehydrogenase-like Zn-dependent alcohol dehydrogenase
LIVELQKTKTRMNTFMQIRRFSAKASKIQNVGVVGLGLMGHGIVQIAAQNGFNVVAVETKKEALDVGMGRFVLHLV